MPQVDTGITRRALIQLGVSTVMASIVPTAVFGQIFSAHTMGESLLAFKSIPIADLLDEIVVPEGYTSQVFYRWGDPISDGPEFKMDASNSATEQLFQAGMHHDALQYYPLPQGGNHSSHGLLVMNHEYIDAQVLHQDGGIFDAPENYTADKTLKEQYAHGVSVIEIFKKGNEWQIKRPSNYARRITARTPMTISGPVAGTKYIQTLADPAGVEILGTFNNCSNGQTPWGTYLTCEENFNGYFQVEDVEHISDKQKKSWDRYNINHSFYGWHHHDERFNASQHPHEPNRFGWIVEFDPYDPQSKPVKRTALGRFAHENVAHKLSSTHRVAFYSGDDTKFEYIYKFITDKPWDGTPGAQHGQLLDSGVLFVACLAENEQGKWLPLVFGEGGLTTENGFENQADILVNARLAAEVVGATPMDRPEWITTHPESGDIYVSMTNNSKRGKKNKPDKDAANPRENNIFGHIIKMVEQDATSVDFSWHVFALAGDEQHQGNIKGALYANPDGLMIDARGVLWVQTDIGSRSLNTDKYAQFGNNQMLAVDPVTGETRRFLTGPVGCEVTGVAMTPDLKSMWVNIQHPGEDVPGILKQQGVEKSPQIPNAVSNWPDHQHNGRPRSATVVITKNDGGVIGS